MWILGGLSEHFVHIFGFKLAYLSNYQEKNWLQCTNWVEKYGHGVAIEK